MIDTLDNNFSISYADACPSELIHDSQNDFLCIALVSFFYVHREKLGTIPQFKNTRNLNRKLRVQKDIINAIKNNVIAPVGVIRWNFKHIALENGEFILHKSKISSKKDYDERIVIDGENLSYGLAVSLAWYSIVIATFFKEMAVICKIAKKKKAALLIDLLSGDHHNNFRNIKVVEYIINNSELEEFHQQAIENNALELIGYGYGIKDGLTKTLKDDFEYSITDWIIQSFHSLLKFEREKLDKSSMEFQLAELAILLIKNGAFKITNAIKLSD